MSVFDGISLPKVIYKTQSELNGEIDVLQDGKTRRLRAQKVTQSLNFDSPYAQKMFWGKIITLLQKEIPDFENILILGLGGGTLQHLISQNFSDAKITSVELDPVMVDVAKKYFDLDKIPNHNVLIEDACKVIVEPEEHNLKHKSFDVVVVDIYCGHKFPDLGRSGNFMAHVAKMTRTDGLVIINRIYLDEFQEDVDIFIDNVEMFLKDVKTLVVPGKTNADNMLIFGRA